MDNSGEFHVGTGNSITGNSWGLTMTVDSYPDAASAGNIPLAGNTNSDGIQVQGGATARANVWRALGADFVVTVSPTINGAGAVTVEDGVTVKFDNAQRILVYGTLNVNGTGSVLFTRRDATDEGWGLWYLGGSSGSIQGATIERCTYSSGYGVYADGVASLALTDLVIQDNDTGVYASNASPSFIRCKIENNLNYGIYLNAACTPTFGSSLYEWNDVYGNGSGNADRDLRNGTEDIAAPYVYWGSTVGATIQNKIHHEPDDAALGLVTFGPWTNAAHDSTFGGAPTAVEGEPIPAAFALSQNRPNPFRGVTAFHYALPQQAHVELVVFDVTGRKVATVVEGEQAAGFKHVEWNPRGLTSGLYFYRLRAGDFVKTREMVLLD
jgi:hypothetical protein